MKTIIAGTRKIEGDAGYLQVVQAVQESGFEITQVVSGGAKGVDKLGELWASRSKVGVRVIPAQWEKDGKAAGFKRNTRMAEYAEALVAVWDGESRGTAHMIEEAKKKGLTIYIKYVEVWHGEVKTENGAETLAAQAVAQADEQRLETPPVDASQDLPSYRKRGQRK